MREICRLAPLKMKDVLEVGCGDGRMTFQYVQSANKVIAIDPSKKAISAARKSTPKDFAAKVSFRVGGGEDLGFPAECFDVVFFSWSLCCTDTPLQARSLLEAWRVLRPYGLLINAMESLHQPFYSGMITYLLRRGSGQPDWTEPERQARLALRHIALVEGKFDFVAEKEIAIHSYYDDLGEALRGVIAENRVKSWEISRKTRDGVCSILNYLRTKKGIRFQTNSVITVLKKHP
jgi:SAM-dependent methyltransferase